MGSVDKWRAMDAVYPAFSKQAGRWTESCLKVWAQSHVHMEASP